MIRSNRPMAAAVFILLTAATGVFAQSSNRLSGRVSLFGTPGTPPVSLNSDQGWIPIAAFDWDNTQLTGVPAGGNRRWRLESSYEHAGVGAPVTLQIRIKGVDGSSVFTHPWSEGSDINAEAYSNWYEDAGEEFLQQGRGIVEARLIAPPRTPATGRLYAVSLEAWDSSNSIDTRNVPAAPAVNLAYVRPLPTDRPSALSRNDQDAQNPELGIDAALDFSLSFVESCLTGNLPAFYRSQSDPVRALDDGKAMARYRLNPPAGIPGITGIEDYKRRYEYSIYPASKFRDLFPEWFDADRPWNPSEDAYLFLGHKDRMAGAFPEGVDYLVFLIEPDENNQWKVVARPRGN